MAVQEKTTARNKKVKPDISDDIQYNFLEPMSVANYTDTYYKEYSLYVLQQRAIPNYIDGFKVVHRKLIRAALDQALNRKIKVAELGSSLSSYEYLHGEVSAQDALVGMAADWKNNVPLFDGHGNFGTRLIQEAAASRYIYVSLSKKFKDVFSDFDVIDARPDNPEPINYLPIIPWSLINGLSGMAVGFACNILPRDWKDVRQSCLEYTQKGKIKTELAVKYPNFKGSIVKVTDNKWTTTGTVEKTKQGRKEIYLITELPVGYDREKYFNNLLKLKLKNKISDFEDACDKSGFKFMVVADVEQMKAIDKDPIAFFGLAKSETENLTTIDENGELRVFANTNDLIRDFCEYRIMKCNQSLALSIKQAEQKIVELRAKRDFIELVVTGKLDLKAMTKKELLTFVTKQFTIVTEIADKIISIPSYSFTKDNIAELENQMAKQAKELVSLQNSNGRDIFIDKLKKLNLD